MEISHKVTCFLEFFFAVCVYLTSFAPLPAFAPCVPTDRCRFAAFVAQCLLMLLQFSGKISDKKRKSSIFDLFFESLAALVPLLAVLRLNA